MTLYLFFLFLFLQNTLTSQKNQNGSLKMKAMRSLTLFQENLKIKNLELSKQNMQTLATFFQEKNIINPITYTQEVIHLTKYGTLYKKSMQALILLAIIKIQTNLMLAQDFLLLKNYKGLFLIIGQLIIYKKTIIKTQPLEIRMLMEASLTLFLLACTPLATITISS